MVITSFRESNELLKKAGISNLVFSSLHLNVAICNFLYNMMYHDMDCNLLNNNKDVKQTMATRVHWMLAWLYHINTPLDEMIVVVEWLESVA